MTGVVQFKAATEAQDAVCDILRRLLDRAENGEILDVAVIWAEMDDGPEFHCEYYGEAQYAALIAGTSMLEFDLHYRRQD